MTVVRRVRIVMAGWPILFTLLVAPFLHTHLGFGDNRALRASESGVAVVHAHFPEARCGSDVNIGRRADLDHAADEAKPFVLVALLTPRAPTISVDVRVGSVAAPVDQCPLLVPLERVNAEASESIHDPPGLRRLALRAPPSSCLI